MPWCRVRYGQAFIWFAGARVRRSLLLKGDVSSAGGVVLDGEETSKHYDTPLTYIGARVHCPACKSEGVIAARGPRWPHSIVGKEQALEGDICVCKCQPFPVMVASQFTSYEEFDEYHLGQMGFNADGTRTPPLASLKEAQDDQPSTLVDHPELICPNMTNEEFRALILRCRDAAVGLIKERERELARWSGQDRDRVEKWFGRQDENVRSVLIGGMARLRAVMQELNPENIIRYSEEKRANISCLPPHNIQNTQASVCKPDSARRFISIYPKFCTLPDSELWTDCKITTLIHECKHYVDVFDSDDIMYGVSIGLSYWAKANPDRAIRNSDSIASYVAFGDSRLWW